jgi:hypothetical protein
MKRLNARLSSIVIILTISALACSLGGQSPEDIATQAAATVIAQLTADAGALPQGDADPPSGAEGEATATSEPESGGPTVSVSTDTNCRGGPSINYNQIAPANVGQVYEIVGQYSGGPYVVIKLPNGSECWLWLQYATIVGDVSGLPNYTPPPEPPPPASPTPSSPFILTHHGYNNCGEDIYMSIVAVQNNSGSPFQSVFVKMIHLRSGGGTHSMFQETNNSPFLNNPNQCASGDWDYIVPGASQLAPGNTAYLSLVSNQRSSAYGENVQVEVKVCTQDNLGGQCYTQVIVYGLPASWGNN